MRIVTIHQAEMDLSRLIEEASKGQEVIIVRGAKPVARLVSVGEVKSKRQPGSLKGKLHVGPEFFEPLTEHEIAQGTKAPVGEPKEKARRAGRSPGLTPPR